MSESLERLNIGPIDLYLLHRDDTRVPAAEILDSLQPFLSRGDLRAVGVSNWTLARIVEANDAARKNGWTPFTTHQVCYSLASANPTLPFPTPTAEDVAWYAKEQFHLMAFSATANGYFEGASSADYDNPVSRRRRERARELGKKYNATPTQVALAWLLARPFPVWPTFSTSRLDHLREALDVGRVRLTREDLEMLGA